MRSHENRGEQLRPDHPCKAPALGLRDLTLWRQHHFLQLGNVSVEVLEHLVRVALDVRFESIPFLHHADALQNSIHLPSKVFGVQETIDLTSGWKERGEGGQRCWGGEGLW